MIPSRHAGRRLRALLASGTAALCATGVAASCSDFRSDGGPATDAGTTDSPGPLDTAAGAEANGADAPADSSANDSASVPDSGDGGAGDARAPPKTLLSNLYGPAAIAVDANYVYWLEVGLSIPQAGGTGQLARVPKDGSCTNRSCAEIIDPYALSGTFEGQLIYDNLVAVGPSFVCESQSFNAQSQHQITCFLLSNLAATVIDQDYGDVDALWMGPSSLLWSIASSSATSADGSIRSRPLAANDGGAATAVASGRPDPTSVLADGTGVVWSELGEADGGGAVMTAGAGGGISRLLPAAGSPVAVAEYGGYVYWIDAGGRTIARTPRAGGGTVETIANTDANPFALVVDASGVYWAAAGLTNPDGSVAYAPLAPGGPTTVLASQVVNISAMAVDSMRVFVAAVGASVNGGGSIVTIDKP
jgi:hypothetical protein